MRTKDTILEEAPCEYCYDKLWRLLKARRMKKKDLSRQAHLSPSVIAKMGRREAVNLETLAKICVVLRCGLSDLVDILPKKEPVGSAG